MAHSSLHYNSICFFIRDSPDRLLNICYFYSKPRSTATSHSKTLFVIRLKPLGDKQINMGFYSQLIVKKVLFCQPPTLHLFDKISNLSYKISNLSYKISNLSYKISNLSYCHTIKNNYHSIQIKLISN